MRYVRLSNRAGVKVSIISLGTWHLPRLPEKDEYGVHRIDVEEFKKILRYCYDREVNFIDTANRYHGGVSPIPLTHVGYAEKLLGRLIRELDLRREELVIATKVGGQMCDKPNCEGLSRKHIMWQIAESLKRLQMDYVDVYYAHRFDPETPKEETLSAFNDLVHRGYVHYIGMSNIPPHHLVDYIRIADERGFEPIAVLQYRYNLVERDIEKDIIPIAQQFGLGITVYSPLAQGFLTGKYYDKQSKKWIVPELSRASYSESFVKRYLTEANLKFMEDFVEFAQSKGVTPTQLALAWIFKRSEELGVPLIPIIGVSRLSQLEEALGALEVRLSGDDMKFLDELYKEFKLGYH